MHLRKEIARQLIISTALIVGCAGAIYGKTILLEELDNSTHVVLYVGDTISVKLKSNITTGYSWSTVDLPASVELVKSKNEPGKEGKVGEPDLHSFAFKAIKPGESVLLLRYSRPFEKDKPAAKTFRVSLSIGHRTATLAN